jgi:hypothetical protein
MWKLLNTGSNINLGDRIRYKEPIHGENIFTVVKTEQHYFEIIPESKDLNSANKDGTKVIRHFDIGYAIGLEVWE